MALGMTTRQLAQRLGAAPSSVSQIQQSEAKRTVSLQSLERVAAALGCRLVYALVPHDGSLEQMVQRRARRVAEQLVRRVSHTMNLENQGVDTRFRETQIRSIAEELVRDLSRELWRSAE